MTLPSEPASVPLARAHAVDALARWGVPGATEVTDAVRLIVSELATNAVQHTLGRSPVFTVALELSSGGLLRLGVTDGHPRPPRRLPAAVQQDNGRGLLIMRSLAAEYGGRLSVSPTPEGGKTVWVELSVARWHSPSASGDPRPGSLAR